MKLARHIIAALVLLAWLFASAHVTLEHGGEDLRAAAVAGGGHHYHHDDAQEHEHDSLPMPDVGHRHHLSGVLSGQSVKTLAAPVFVALWALGCGSLGAGLDALQLERNRGLERSRSESPPDERACGWLFVVHTARPVRGPSLAA